MREDRVASPTLEDVARAAGVSRATVSRVINGIRNVDPSIQEAVRRAIAEVGYVPNRAARQLVTGKTGSIALIVSGAGQFFARVFTDPFFGRVVEGISGHLRPLGVHLVLMLAEAADARTQVVDYVREGHVDGAILVTTHADDPLPAMLAESGTPVVLFARPDQPIPISYVDLAHGAGARMAADHLVARGCERVATISGPLDVLASMERQSGFREAMARHGHAYVPSVAGNFTKESGETAMARLLDDHPNIDGLFVANDLMAQGALEVAAARGLRIPADLKVVGFDDSTAALACRPPLTTIRHPVEDMSAEMSRLLLAQIEDPARRPKSVIFEPELVVRESA
ncbi:LacI family DNA-binding transcriptional regulator [Herbidospora cretacea]|uniref:LacI family DNA-binding transcriptional regulator n=1 Tax=Herbidospora cretacea TaxID=28444 RepID=UPI0007742885|nr:LacI family DNA-binding transcriptional regulator [Herbidospora cretacea]